MRARFDLVGFDPRGIARSTALRCFGNDKQWAPYFTPFAFPLTVEEEQAWIAADLYLDGACAQRGGRIIDHMSTANVARDLDVLRRAVGDAKLTYAGYSRAPLGQVYASMFPANFARARHRRSPRSDRVVNTGGAIPFSTRLRSDAGAMATPSEFFRLCDLGGPRCAFAPGSATRFAALAAKLRAAPAFVNIPDVFVGELNYSLFISLTLGAMYRLVVMEFLDDVLAETEAQVGASAAAASVAGTSLQPALRPEFIAKRGFPRYMNFIEGFPAVACSDSDNPDAYAAWSAAAAAAGSSFGYFGPL